jgi:2-methylfumaryl-CoA isomerase
VYGTFGHDFGTRDGQRVMVLALTPRQWVSLGEATGLSRAFSEFESRVGANFRKEGDRWTHRKQLCELLDPWVAQRDLAEVRKAFDQHGVLWSPYQRVKELVADDPRASIANPMFAEVNHPGLGTFLTTGSPLRFSATKPVQPGSAPTLGEHTEEVLREFGLKA